jgi:prophage regulatory protein
MTSNYFYRLPDVLKQTGLGRSTLYAAIANGEFPPPRKIGARAVAWRQDELEEWINNRPVTNAFNQNNQ